MPKPITPQEAKAQKLLIIPNYIIEAVNELLIKHLSSGRAIILRDAIIYAAYMRWLECSGSANFDFFKKNLYDNHFLDFEDIYISAGWKVTYHRPDYTEFYDPYYEFEC